MDEQQACYTLIARAKETLAEAELLLQSGYRFGAINRLYYACFYAVSALLLSEGMSSSKHTGAISLFDQHWIKPARLPREMGRFYRKLFDLRHQGDYAGFLSIGEAEMVELQKETRRFIDNIERALPSATEQDTF
jgi:uncharacterized protein (UPF0332 family)